MMQGLTIKAGTHPSSAKFMVGDKELMVMGADIRMRPDEVITATIEVPIEHIDVELMTSGVTIEPLDDFAKHPTRTAYVIVSDDAPQQAIRYAVAEKAKYLDKKFPFERFDIRVVKQGDIREV